MTVTQNAPTWTDGVIYCNLLLMQVPQQLKIYGAYRGALPKYYCILISFCLLDFACAETIVEDGTQEIPCDMPD